nr:6223_t:CDS:2 [Entrophospora candida]
MSPITRSQTSLRRWLYPVFPTSAQIEDAFQSSVVRIQGDARKLLGVNLSVLEIRQNLYNSSLQEYWLVNNFEALQDVMYYIMKRKLFKKYKDQLIAAGVEVAKIMDSMQLSIMTIIDDSNKNPNNSLHYRFVDSQIIIHNDDDSNSNIANENFNNNVDGICGGVGSSINSSINSSDEYTDNDDDNNSDEDINTDDGINSDGQDFDDIDGTRGKQESLIIIILGDIQYHFENIISRLGFPNCLYNLKNLGMGKQLLIMALLLIMMYNIGFKDVVNDQRLTNQHHKLNTVQLRGKVKEQVLRYVEEEISKRSPDLINHGNINKDQLTKIIHGSSTDYALYTSGAQIINKLTSRVYEEWPTKMHQRIWGYFTHRNLVKSREPDVVIKPNINVGECWCFNGTKGQIAIELSRNIIFTHVALHHIGKNVSIDPINNKELFSDNDSKTKTTATDKKFKLFNKKVLKNKDFNIFLGQYQYDLTGKPLQLFHLPESIARTNNKRIQAIIMKILNNHENPKFTCLYRLQRLNEDAKNYIKPDPVPIFDEMINFFDEAPSKELLKKNDNKMMTSKGRSTKKKLDDDVSSSPIEQHYEDDKNGFSLIDKLITDKDKKLQSLNKETQTGVVRIISDIFSTADQVTYNFHIHSGYNNTIITLANSRGDTLITKSSGIVGFKKAQRGGYEAAHQTATAVINAIKEKKIKVRNAEMFLKGFGSGREAAFKAIASAENEWSIKRVTDSTPTPFNGCRPKKTRRL